jgi:folylpolyglutamate synthase/dihydropteroate synthase
LTDYRGRPRPGKRSLAHDERRNNEISDGSLRNGLARTRWPGRLEVIGRHPMVLVDGATTRRASSVRSRRCVGSPGTGLLLIVIVLVCGSLYLVGEVKVALDSGSDGRVPSGRRGSA